VNGQSFDRKNKIRLGISEFLCPMQHLTGYGYPVPSTSSGQNFVSIRV